LEKKKAGHLSRGAKKIARDENHHLFGRTDIKLFEPVAGNSAIVVHGGFQAGFGRSWRPIRYRGEQERLAITTAASYYTMRLERCIEQLLLLYHIILIRNVYDLLKEGRRSKMCDRWHV